MRVFCLCPTYGRTPELLANSLQCFSNQIESRVPIQLVIYDDLGNLNYLYVDGGLHNGFVGGEVTKAVAVLSSEVREPDIMSKYRRMLEWLDVEVDGIKPDDILLLWDDDDLYLPQHISDHVNLYMNAGVDYVYPENVLSTYTGNIQVEPSGGRFWASCSFTFDLYDALGGFPNTRRADFDQQWLQMLFNKQGAMRGVAPTRYSTYIFRWADTMNNHSQGKMKSPEDETWWDEVQPSYVSPINSLEPCFDSAANATMNQVHRKFWEAMT